jgi:hypothetical protein
VSPTDMVDCCLSLLGNPHMRYAAVIGRVVKMLSLLTQSLGTADLRFQEMNGFDVLLDRLQRCAVPANDTAFLVTPKDGTTSPPPPIGPFRWPADKCSAVLVVCCGSS